MSTSTTEAKPLMTDEDVAARLKVEPRTVRLWAQMGDMPAPCIDRPRCKRWHPEDIEQWIDRGRKR